MDGSGGRWMFVFEGVLVLGSVNKEKSGMCRKGGGGRVCVEGEDEFGGLNSCFISNGGVKGDRGDGWGYD